MNIYYNLIILLYFIKLSKAYLIIPLKFTNINATIDDIKTNYLSKIYSDNLYLNISIGTNNETIKGLLDMGQVGFYIYENAYNYNSSSSFMKDNKTISFNKRNYEKGYISNDTLCIYNIKDITKPKIEKCTGNNNIIKFALLKHIEDNIYANYSIVGLQQNDYYDENSVPLFIHSLKKGDLIDSYTFSFSFNNKEKKEKDKDKDKGDINNNEIIGYLFLGYEYEENEEFEIKQFSSVRKFGNPFWFISFSEICVGLNNSYDTSSQNKYQSFHYTEVELIGSLPYLVGIYEYNIYIKFHFFYDFLSSKICNYTGVPLNPDYSTFVCDSKSEIFMNALNTKFPKLYFIYNETNTTFILDKEDLFTYNLYNESDNLIYFLVFFYNHNGQYDDITKFKLGMPFFKKYKLSFNSDARIIKYYEKVNNKKKEEEKNIKNNEKVYLVIKIIVIIVLLIIFFGLGFLFHRIITKTPRKKRLMKWMMIMIII